ncbi:MAG: glycosyltransferase family 2 protein, partial [Saprospiraceae bacterium]|nr:glycosyltransferase family 2 protein [Saprospiraceae bacterium]
MGEIALVTTTNAPARALQDFVNYHLNLGIAHLYLYYDNPSTAEEGQWPPECVTTNWCTPAYWTDRGMNRPELVAERQTCNATHALSLARHHGYPWIAHIDTDELLYAQVPLDEVLRGLPSSVDRVICALHEALPGKDEYHRPFLEINTFRRKPASRQTKWLRMLPLRRAMMGGAYLKGHHNSKSLVRTSASVERLGV